MKRVHVNRLSIYTITVFFLICRQTYAGPDLVSIKTGAERDRLWAALQFSEPAALVGVSQLSESRIGLYFSGNARENDGNRVALDNAQSTVAAVKQLSLSPPVFSVTLNYIEWQPVAILKRDNSVVIAVNDYRLLDKTMASVGPSSFFAQLTEVTDNMAFENQVLLQFDGAPNWVGYLKPAYDQAALLFCDAQVGTFQDVFGIHRGHLTDIRIVTPTTGADCIKVELGLASVGAFHLVQTGNTVVYRENGDKMPFDKADPEPTLVENVFTPEAESAWLTETSDWDAPPPPSETPAGSLQVLSGPADDAGASGARSTVPDIPVSQGGGIPWDQIVSFDFPNTPIRDALRLIGATNQINMVIGAGVEGQVSMNLNEVTLKRALELILHTHNLEYLVEGDVITIKPVKVSYSGGRMTKIYRLRYADAANVANVVKRIASSDSLVQVFSPEFLEYAEAGKNRKTAAGVGVQGIRRATILVVTDRPEKIREIDAIIAEIDTAPLQIMIESKMVEVSPQTSKSLGIDWDESISMFLEGQGLNTNDQSRNFQIEDGAQNIGFYGAWKTGTLSANQYLALVNFLKTRTDVELKLSPKLLAMDNEESSISVGTTVPIPEIQQQTGGGGSGQERITFSYKEVNIQLNVVPHVGENNEITMYVNPIIEEISDWVVFGGQRAPITSKRAVNSIVTVKSGETIVIGGLVKNQASTKLKKVFLLGDLPLLGRIFQHESVETTQTEVMIFITPTIVAS